MTTFWQNASSEWEVLVKRLYYLGKKYKTLHEGPPLPLRTHFKPRTYLISFNILITSGVLCGNKADIHSNKNFSSNIEVFGIIKNCIINEVKEKKLYDVNHILRRKRGLNFQKFKRIKKHFEANLWYFKTWNSQIISWMPQE